MSELISVIIPVYNVAAYLPECLDTVLSQNYSNLQVILIDDGSTDASGSICDEYATRDSRVVVIHQKNGGAAAAKNAGLRIATGEYLSFVDSDDYLEPNAYLHLVELLRTYHAEVVQCGYRDVFVNMSIDRPCTDQTCEYDVNDYMKMYTTDWTCGLMTDKLFVRSLFDEIFFEEGHKIDDEYFTYRGIMNAKKIVRDSFVFYNYRKRRSSVMYSPESGKQILKDRIDYLSKRRVNVVTRFPELRQIFDRHYVDTMVILSRDSLATKETNAIIKQKIRMYLKEKGHTPVDIHLWPALLKLALGRVPKTTPKKEMVYQENYYD